MTFAARDSEYGGHSIKEGEILAMEDGKLAFVEKDLTKAVRQADPVDGQERRRLCDGDLRLGCVGGYGGGGLRALLRARLSDDIELNLVNGGQPVYYYIISVE